MVYYYGIVWFIISSFFTNFIVIMVLWYIMGFKGFFVFVKNWVWDFELLYWSIIFYNTIKTIKTTNVIKVNTSKTTKNNIFYNK